MSLGHPVSDPSIISIPAGASGNGEESTYVRKARMARPPDKGSSGNTAPSSLSHSGLKATLGLWPPVKGVVSLVGKHMTEMTSAWALSPGMGKKAVSVYCDP